MDKGGHLFSSPMAFGIFVGLAVSVRISIPRKAPAGNWLQNIAGSGVLVWYGLSVASRHPMD
ncbi:MAG: hypothetical protein ABFR47_06480 [Verrucomicrobiota bacterium]